MTSGPGQMARSTWSNDQAKTWPTWSNDQANLVKPGLEKFLPGLTWAVYITGTALLVNAINFHQTI